LLDHDQNGLSVMVTKLTVFPRHAKSLILLYLFY